MFDFILNAQFWLIFTPFCGFLFKFWQYVDTKRMNQQQRNFDNYHTLIERITRPRDGDNATYVDIQLAAIFELRNYKEYKEITEYILTRWQHDQQYEELIGSTLRSLNKGYGK